MKISLAADHGAFELRETLLAHLEESGIEVIDHGTKVKESVDFPDYAVLVADDVVKERADFGILCCTTGIGMSISANKVPGIRAALVHYEDQAYLTRAHNNSNVLCLGQLHTTTYEALRLVDIFLKTEPEAGRHARRVGKISDLEARTSCA